MFWLHIHLFIYVCGIIIKFYSSYIFPPPLTNYLITFLIQFCTCLSVFLLLGALIVALWASGFPSLNKNTYLPTYQSHILLSTCGPMMSVWEFPKWPNVRLPLNCLIYLCLMAFDVMNLGWRRVCLDINILFKCNVIQSILYSRVYMWH